MKQMRKADVSHDACLSGVSQDDLMYYYQSVVRPVLESACPCWHLSLSKEQTKQLEDVQRRALQVIFGNIQYDEVRCTYNIPSLAERRFELCSTFFQRIIRNKLNVLWYLLPTRRDSELTARLRCARQYRTIYALTNRYKNSIIVYGLNHWQ